MLVSLPMSEVRNKVDGLEQLIVTGAGRELCGLFDIVGEPFLGWRWRSASGNRPHMGAQGYGCLSDIPNYFCSGSRASHTPACRRASRLLEVQRIICSWLDGENWVLQSRAGQSGGRPDFGQHRGEHLPHVQFMRAWATLSPEC